MEKDIYADAYAEFLRELYGDCPFDSNGSVPCPFNPASSNPVIESLNEEIAKCDRIYSGEQGTNSAGFVPDENFAGDDYENEP